MPAHGGMHRNSVSPLHAGSPRRASVRNKINCFAVSPLNRDGHVCVRAKAAAFPALG